MIDSLAGVVAPVSGAYAGGGRGFSLMMLLQRALKSLACEYNIAVLVRQHTREPSRALQHLSLVSLAFVATYSLLAAQTTNYTVSSGGARVSVNDLRPALGARATRDTDNQRLCAWRELTDGSACVARTRLSLLSGESWSTFADTRILLDSVSAPGAAAMRRAAGSAPATDASATSIRVRLSKSPRQPPGAHCLCELAEAGFVS